MVRALTPARSMADFEDERVHDGRQHAHRVRRRPRQARFRNLRPPQNVAAADDDTQAYAKSAGGDEISGKTVD